MCEGKHSVFHENTYQVKLWALLKLLTWSCKQLIISIETMFHKFANLAFQYFCKIIYCRELLISNPKLCQENYPKAWTVWGLPFAYGSLVQESAQLLLNAYLWEIHWFIVCLLINKECRELEMKSLLKRTVVSDLNIISGIQFWRNGRKKPPTFYRILKTIAVPSHNFQEPHEEASA